MNRVVGSRIANEIGTPLKVDAPKNVLAEGHFVILRWILMSQNL